MTKYIIAASVSVTIVLTATWGRSAEVSQTQWQRQLHSELTGINRSFDGDMGVYIKRLSDGREVNFQSDRKWYLASTIKVFVGASLLYEVEAGRLKLSDRVVLRKADFVDGSGEVIWKKPGAVMSLGYLFNKMLTQSDSTATDILIRKIGQDRLNRFIQDHTAGINTVTTIVAVRNHAYGEAHPKAEKLGNLDFIAFKRSPPSQRLKALARRLGISQRELQVSTLEEAFERYYRRGLNSGRLDSFGNFIERLLTGQILSKAHTQLMQKTMRAAVTGKKRIQAGLPKDWRFAQKTGTQIGRMCNVGMISMPRGGSEFIVAACIENFPSFKDGEAVFQKIGSALSQVEIIR